MKRSHVTAGICLVFSVSLSANAFATVLRWPPAGRCNAPNYVAISSRAADTGIILQKLPDSRGSLAVINIQPANINAQIPRSSRSCYIRINPAENRYCFIGRSTAAIQAVDIRGTTSNVGIVACQ